MNEGRKTASKGAQQYYKKERVIQGAFESEGQRHVDDYLKNACIRVSLMPKKSFL